jgi:hypothetical protein
MDGCTNSSVDATCSTTRNDLGDMMVAPTTSTDSPFASQKDDTNINSNNNNDMDRKIRFAAQWIMTMYDRKRTTTTIHPPSSSPNAELLWLLDNDDNVTPDGDLLLWTHCIIVVCGAIPTVLAIAQHVVRTLRQQQQQQQPDESSTTTTRQFDHHGDIITYIVQYAVPTLLLPYASYSKTKTTTTTTDASSTTNIGVPKTSPPPYLSIWYDDGFLERRFSS